MLNWIHLCVIFRKNTLKSRLILLKKGENKENIFKNCRIAYIYIGVIKFRQFNQFMSKDLKSGKVFFLNFEIQLFIIWLIYMLS